MLGTWHLQFYQCYQYSRQQHTFVIITSVFTGKIAERQVVALRGSKGVCKHLSLLFFPSPTPSLLSTPSSPNKLPEECLYSGLDKWTLNAQGYMVLIPFVQTSSMMLFCLSLNHLLWTDLIFSSPSLPKFSCSLIAHRQSKGMWNKLFQPGSFV